MDKYYYLISQLPTLSFGKEAQITIDKFLEEAEKWLSSRDYERLVQVSIDSHQSARDDHPVIKSFKHLEHKIREDIALWREAKKRDQEYKPVSFPVSLLKESNPLEAEIKLMEKRWELIDAMERDYNFGFAPVLLYYLKLQVLRRYFIFDKEKGLQKFQKLYEVDLS
ncbi:DUF2764 family protein [candidate division KSB1 bacterium]|nr:DUF2764 family protein [candidate division KSB1 bacterium]